MKKLKRNQKGFTYILITIVAFLFIIGLASFFFLMVMQPISVAIQPIANSFHNSTWVMDTPLTYAEQFMDYFWQFMLVFAMFGLAFWVWMYSQHRGQPY